MKHFWIRNNTKTNQQSLNKKQTKQRQQIVNKEADNLSALIKILDSATSEFIDLDRIFLLFDEIPITTKNMNALQNLHYLFAALIYNFIWINIKENKADFVKLVPKLYSAMTMHRLCFEHYMFETEMTTVWLLKIWDVSQKQKMHVQKWTLKAYEIELGEPGLTQNQIDYLSLWKDSISFTKLPCTKVLSCCCMTFFPSSSLEHSMEAVQDSSDIPNASVFSDR